MPSSLLASMAHTVAWPWPCGEVPVKMVALPSGCTCTVAFSWASSGCLICALIMAMGGATSSRSRSAPVNAAITPGARSAPLTSTPVIRAWATADRTKCT